MAHIQWELTKFLFPERCIALAVVVILCRLQDAGTGLTCPAEATHTILTPICVPTLERPFTWPNPSSPAAMKLSLNASASELLAPWQVLLSTWFFSVLCALVLPPHLRDLS